ncbi:MAG: NADH:ubiquinone reductase (Na(+)-transporting) subunit A, partial [Melioribacteraceae bacterium]
MEVIKIKKGLDIPISGEPSSTIDPNIKVKHVAILGNDYVGMKPTMQVGIGDSVKLGQLLFTDKKMPGVKFTSPGTGKIVGISRGEKRVFLSMVIALDGDDEETFNSYLEAEINSLSAEQIKEQLINSGVWTSLRERPFSKVANPAITPHSIFVTAMDSNPLAPSIEKVLRGREAEFKNGLKILSKLTEGSVYLCKKNGTNIASPTNDKIQVKEFSGPHPSGLVGTHIHFIDSASRSKHVWYINAQDVAMIGELFTTGKINTERVISLAGPSVKNPRLVKTQIGASLFELTDKILSEGENRIISGSVLSGRTATKEEGYLGRYHQ